MQLLNTKKPKGDTKGHEYQHRVADAIISALTPEQRSRVTVTVAAPSSTLPDITLSHSDHPDDPLIVECKLNNSQSGGVTWNYDGASWDYSRQSKKAEQVYKSAPEMYSTVHAFLHSPLVLDRIAKIQGNLAEWFPELKSNTVPFAANKEFWNALLDKHSIGDEGDKWQVPMDDSFWKSLNAIMMKDHFVHIEGCGLFRIDGNSLPSWFKPSEEFMSKVPLVTGISEPPKGSLELRLKQGGMTQRKTQVGRCLLIRSTVPPKEGQFVHVEDLGSMGKNVAYDHPVGLIFNRKRANYFVNSTESGCIGEIERIHRCEVHHSSKGCDEGESILWAVECDLSHRIGCITFETNLRILDITARSGVNLERDSTEFSSFL